MGKVIEIKDLPTLDKAFEAIEFSKNTEKTGMFFNSSAAGVHPIGYGVQAMYDAAMDENLAPQGYEIDWSNSEFIGQFMNWGDPLLTALVDFLIKEKKIGKVKLIGNGDSGFDPKAGQPYSAFRQDQLDYAGWMGDETRYLVEKLGFKVNPEKEARFEVLVNGANGDIMHEKNFFLKVKFRKRKESGWAIGRFMDRIGDLVHSDDSKLKSLIMMEDGEPVLYYSVFLTDNATPREQSGTKVKVQFDYQTEDTIDGKIVREKVQLMEAAPSKDWVLNRVFVPRLASLNKDHYDHMIALGAAFRKTGKIEDIVEDPETERLTFQFPDGSFLQRMYTNHRRDPWQRVLELEKAVMAGDFELLEVVHSHYQFVNGDVLEADRRMADKSPNARFKLYVDEAAIDARKGGAGAYVGIPVPSNLGLHMGFLPQTRGSQGHGDPGRIEAWVYRRGQTAQNQEKLDRKTANTGSVLNHDKTSIYKVRDKQGRIWYLILTGTFNMSYRKVNAEYQWAMWVPEGSDIAKTMVDTTVTHQKQNPQYYEPAAQTILLKSLADYIGVESKTIQGEQVLEFERFVRKGLYRDAIKVLQALRETGKQKKPKRERGSGSDLKGKEDPPVNDKEFAERMQMLNKALNAWRETVEAMVEERAVQPSVLSGFAGAISDVFTDNAIARGIRKYGGRALNAMLPGMFGETLSEFQQIMLVNGLNIERKRFLESNGELKSTGERSRLRFYYGMGGGQIAELPQEQAMKLAWTLYDISRESAGLPMEDLATFTEKVQQDKARMDAIINKARSSYIGTEATQPEASSGSEVPPRPRRTRKPAAAEEPLKDDGKQDACKEKLKPSRKKAKTAA